MRIGLSCVPIVLAACVLLPAQDPFRKAPPEIEEALRTRVTEFYTLYQQGKFRQTEAYIDEDSRDAYYGSSKSRIHGFELKDIKFAEDFQSAQVVVTCQTMVAIQNSGTKVPLPVHSRWKRVDGQWYALMGRGEDGDTVNTPFGKMKFQKRDEAAALNMPKPVKPASFAGMYALSSGRVLKFSAKDPVTQTIALSNKGPVPLKLRQETQSVDGLEIGIEPQQIEEGETMTVSFTYRPDVAKLDGTRKIEFTVLPINQAFLVTAEFAE